MSRYGLESRPPLARWLSEEMRMAGKGTSSEDDMRFMLYRVARWMIQASTDRAVPFWGRVACSVAAKILEREVARHA